MPRLAIAEIKGRMKYFGPVIPFKNENNNSGQLKYTIYISLSLSVSLFLPLSFFSLFFSLSLSLTSGEGVLTLFTGQRERELHASRNCGRTLSVPHSLIHSISHHA
jgi:hypothetical protein